MDNQLYKSIINSSNDLEKISKTLFGIENQIQSLNITCQELSTTLSNVSFSDMLGDVSNIVSITTSLIDTKLAIESLSGESNKFADFLSKLTSGPVLALSVGIAAVVAGFSYLESSFNSVSSETEKYLEKVNTKTEALHNNTEELKRNSEAAIDNASAIQGDYSLTLSQIDQLVALTGRDGYAGNIEKAKFLAEQINQVLPNSVEITKDGKVAWQDNIETLKDYIKQMEKMAIIESYRDNYIEAIKNRPKYEAEVTAALKEQQAAEEKVSDLEKKVKDYRKEHGHDSMELVHSLRDANKELDAQNQHLSEAQNQLGQCDKNIRLYSNSVDAFDENIASSAALQADAYTDIEENGTASWGKLSSALQDLDRQQEEHIAKGLDASSREVQITSQTAELIREQCVEKAHMYGQSYLEMIKSLEENGGTLLENEKELLKEQYDNYKSSTDNKTELQKMGFDAMIAQLEESGVSFTEVEKGILAEQFLNWEDANKAKEGIQSLSYESMLTYLESAGIELTEAEKKHLEDQYAYWKENAQNEEQIQKEKFENLRSTLDTQLNNMNEEEKKQLQESIRILSESGTTGGYELCHQLSDSLAKNNGKVTSETQGIIDQINNMTNSADPTINVGTQGPSNTILDGIITGAQSILSAGASLPIGVKKENNGIKILGKVFDLSVFASGGFPDTGELFIAREAGPELVGRIHGKTAVANNDQIVSGISSGVYNAMVGALSQMGSKNTTVTAIFQVDGKQVARKVIQAHNQEVLQTGRSPLLI